MNVVMYRDILNENLFQSVFDFRLDRRFIFQQDNDLKNIVRILMEWFYNNFVNVFEWFSQSLDLNFIEYFWRDLKMVVYRCFLFNMIEFERYCKEGKNF